MSTTLKDILNDLAESIKTAIENPQDTLTTTWEDTKDALVEEALDGYKVNCIGD